MRLAFIVRYNSALRLLTALISYFSVCARSNTSRVITLVPLPFGFCFSVGFSRSSECHHRYCMYGLISKLNFARQLRGTPVNSDFQSPPISEPFLSTSVSGLLSGLPNATPQGCWFWLLGAIWIVESWILIALLDHEQYCRIAQMCVVAWRRSHFLSRYL